MVTKQNYLLRPLKTGDAAGMLEWMQDNITTRYLRIDGRAYTIDDVLRFIEEAKNEASNIHRAIVDRNDAYLGTVSLKNIDREKREAEYAIALHPKAQGSGAAYDATEEILTIAFQTMGLERIYLNVMEENQRAIRFYEKFGFVYRKKTVANIKNEFKTLFWYDINPSHSLK